MSGTNTVSAEDERLLKGCLGNDGEAQRRLYEKYAPRMLALCRRYFPDRDDAQDVLQDGFVTVFTKMGTYSGEGPFEGWMRRIFVNEALMRLRRNDVLRDTEDIAGMKVNVPSEGNVVENIGAKEIYGLIMSMPKGFRTVFNLYAVEGFSHAEIAEALGISEGTSRSQLNRARVWLQEKIKDMGYDYRKM